MYLPMRIHHAGNIVAIERIGGYRHGILYRFLAVAVSFRHHVIAHHPPGLPDIQLVREVAVVFEFIFRQTPAFHFRAQGIGYPWIIAQEPE